MSTGWNDLEDIEVYPARSDKRQGNNLLVVDAFNLAFRYKHERYALSDKSIKPEDITPPHPFAEEYRDTIQSLAESYNASYVFIVADGIKSSEYRRQLFPEYKQNRALIQAEQTPAEQHMFQLFWNEYIATLELLKTQRNYTVIRYDGVEADDIAAYIASNVPTGIDNVWLVSSDKDWDQLIDHNVSRFNWATQKRWKNIQKTGPRPREITIENWGEHHLGTRDQYLSLRALIGDPSDNIDGVKGVGDKRALTLIEKHGSLKNLLEAIPLPGTAQYVQNLNAAKDRLETNLRIMDLKNYQVEALGEENIEELDSILFSIGEF